MVYKNRGEFAGVTLLLKGRTSIYDKGKVVCVKWEWLRHHALSDSVAVIQVSLLRGAAV